MDGGRESVPQGTRIMIGRPAAAPDPERIRALVALLAGDKRIQEAHLPQMLVEGLMEEAGLALVLVLRDMGQGAAVAQELAGRLKPLYGEEPLPPIIPLDARSDLLEPVREAGCTLKVWRPWWKVWG